MHAPSGVHKPAQCLKLYRAWNPKQHKLHAVAKQLQSQRIGRAAPLRSPCSRNNLHLTQHNSHAEAAKSSAWC